MITSIVIKFSCNYISGGYRYTKNRESNGTIYLKCTLARQNACEGLAKISTLVNLLEITRAHNHSESEYKSHSIVLANRIKRTAEISIDNLRQIFNLECRNSTEAATTLTFKTLESTMFKRRRSHLPKLPVSPEEFDQLLTNSPYSKFHRLTIRDCDEKAVVFASDLMLLKLKEAEIIHFDATFDVVPRIFYQLLTIFIRIKGHAIPALHILMTSKSEHLYTAVVLAIHELVPEFNPSIAMCDFEKASRNAFKTVRISLSWDVGFTIQRLFMIKYKRSV